MHRRLALKGCALALLLPESPVSFAKPAQPFDDARLHLVGRFDLSEPEHARFAWSSSALHFRFVGREASLVLEDSGENRFLIEADGEARAITTRAGRQTVALVARATPGPCEVRVTRITEARLGESAFVGAPQTDGELLDLPRATRRLLVIGDSITCGYGVEGDDPSCGFSPATQNQSLSYAALAARTLGAELHSIAWSGIGVYRNYGEERPGGFNMPLIHGRVLPERRNSPWDPARYRPDGIVINLGSNDYWNGEPPAKAYPRAMAALCEELRGTYRDTPIYLMASPLLEGDLRAAQVRALAGVAASFEGGRVHLLDIERVRADEGWGCDAHPSRATHARQGAALAARLRGDLGWR